MYKSVQFSSRERPNVIPTWDWYWNLFWSSFIFRLNLITLVVGRISRSNSCVPYIRVWWGCQELIRRDISWLELCVISRETKNILHIGLFYIWEGHWYGRNPVGINSVILWLSPGRDTKNTDFLRHKKTMGSVSGHLLVKVKIHIDGVSTTVSEYLLEYLFDLITCLMFYPVHPHATV